MKKTLTTFICVASFILLSSSFTEQEKTATMAKYLVSLVRYFEWPGEMRTGNFKIGVYGSFEMYRSISEHTMGTGLQNRNVDVINLSRLSQAGFSKPHLLIISEDKCSYEVIRQAQSIIGSAPTLIITDKKGALKFGSSINFIPNDDKLEFELNVQNIVKNGVLINKSIQAFASRVVQ